MSFSERRRSKLIVGIALLVTLPALVIIIVYSLAGGTTAFMPVSGEAQWKYVREYTDKLNDRNADIIFYKKSPNGPDNLKARRVNALNEQGLNMDMYRDCAYHVIILNDLDGNLDITSEDLMALIDLMTNSGFRIIYLGERMYPELYSAGLVHSVPSKGTKSYMTFYNKHGAPCYNSGIADDPISMPITEGLTDEQEIVFTLVMELAQKDFYWS